MSNSSCQNLLVNDTTGLVHVGDDTYLRLSLMICGGLLALVTLFGNASVLALVLKYDWLRCNINYVISSMAVGDMMIGLLVVPMVLYARGSSSTIPHVLCKAILSIDVTFSILTFLHIMLLNIERYISIQHPLRYVTLVTGKRTVISLVVIWCFTFILGVGVFVMTITTYTDECIMMPPDTLTVVSLSGLMVLLIVPVVTLSVFYARIYIIVRRHIKFAKSQVIHGKEHKSSGNEMKTIRTIIVILGVVTASWAPYQIAILVFSLVEQCSSRIVILKYILPVTGILFYLNSALNPFIYAMCSPLFKKAYKQLFGCL